MRLELFLAGGESDKDEVLLGPLLGNVLGCLLGDSDPGLGEERAGGEDEQDVEHNVEGVLNQVSERLGRRHVVCNSAHRHRPDVKKIESNEKSL